jgi:hypothetical protein
MTKSKKAGKTTGAKPVRIKGEFLEAFTVAKKERVKKLKDPEQKG